MGLQCRSEYCWSCPVDTGSGLAIHGMFWRPLAAWALGQVLCQSGGENTCYSQGVIIAFSDKYRRNKSKCNCHF